MRAIVYSSKIKKDLKLSQKRGLNLDPFYEVVSKIAKGELLEPINQDHPLHGKLTGKRACHIKPDWVLIYAVKKMKSCCTALVRMRIYMNSCLFAG